MQVADVEPRPVKRKRKADGNRIERFWRPGIRQQSRWDGGVERRSGIHGQGGKIASRHRCQVVVGPEGLQRTRMNVDALDLHVIGGIALESDRVAEPAPAAGERQHAPRTNARDRS